VNPLRPVMSGVGMGEPLRARCQYADMLDGGFVDSDTATLMNAKRSKLYRSQPVFLIAQLPLFV
jgi:hypothetical protein